VTLTVNPRLGARQALVRGGYTPGGTVTIASTFFYPGIATGATWRVQLPAGWSFNASKGDDTATKPAPGATDLIEWSWAEPPASPIVFVYSLNVPLGTSGNVSLQATATVRQAGVAAPLVAQTDPLVVAPALPRHSADADADGRISLSELLRVLDLYNTRKNTVRTGAYGLNALSDDGFTPDQVRTEAAPLPGYHSADINRDGRLSLSEITRVIELFNTRSGSLRTGSYRLLAGSEDGFAPLP
jgi:hypothetical protein